MAKKSTSRSSSSCCCWGRKFLFLARLFSLSCLRWNFCTVAADNRIGSVSVFGGEDTRDGGKSNASDGDNDDDDGTLFSRLGVVPVFPSPRMPSTFRGQFPSTPPSSLVVLPSTFSVVCYREE